MSDLHEAETAVRNYLLFREDPTQLVDADQVAALEAVASAAKDPIDKLKALAALTRARSLDAQTYEQAFIQHARSWATKNDIPAASFRELGIPDAVLRSAGLGPAGKSRVSAVKALRSKSVSAKDIQQYIVQMPRLRFTLAEVANEFGGSPMTVRKAFDELVHSGVIIKQGPTPEWSGPGRAPILFVKNQSNS
jgi:hypothetical protein